jgi:hypothetical protein
MARKPDIAELSTRLLMTALGSERRYKRVFVIGGIGAVGLGVGIFFVLRAAGERRQAAEEQAFGALRGCLIGEAALEKNEKPSARMASIRLGVAGSSFDKRGGWPSSCGKLAFNLSSLSGKTPLGEAAEALGKSLDADPNATLDHSSKVDALFAEAAAQKLEGKASGDGPKAPKPAAAKFTADELAELPTLPAGSFRLPMLREEPQPGGKIYFLVDENGTKSGPQLCAVTPADAAVSCLKLPAPAAALSPNLQLFGTTDDGARPFYFAGERGKAGVFPPDAKAPLALGTGGAQPSLMGASAHKDGSLAVLFRRKTKELELDLAPASGAPSEVTEIAASEIDPSDRAGLFWDWLLYRSAPKDGGAGHLVARHLEGTTLKEAIDVGELEEPVPSEKDVPEAFDACKSDEALAVRVRGDKSDSLTFFSSGRWSAPIAAATHGGGLSCHGLEAVSLTVEHADGGEKDYATILHSKCNPAGCTNTTISLRKLFGAAPALAPADANDLVAVDVAGKLAIIWNSPAGGLRMRIGAPEAIGEASDVIIAAPSGEKGAVNQLRAVTSSAWAIAFLETTAGVRALRIEPSGKLSPLGG